MCIVAATDENDNIFMRVSGLGSESFEKYKKYSFTFEDSNPLVSDSKSSISHFSNYLGLKHDKILLNQIKNDILKNMIIVFNH